MARVKTYLRIALNPSGRVRHKVVASTSPNHQPLKAGSGMSERVLPTIAFAVVLDIPDEAFRQAQHVIAEITVPADVPAVAAAVEAA